ncbi:hypothetical protein T4C_7196 [Trichinella pseudospiralis]|uniref:Uncharacterized protein n=1 Tax=Trichinella pseudospiralis TaxID=6337 RepID=A0A0V1JZ40_TRIPS|nr:hypothetical protein T4C_7196 [Trichinella pseudospiralis]
MILLIVVAKTNTVVKYVGYVIINIFTVSPLRSRLLQAQRFIVMLICPFVIFYFAIHELWKLSLRYKEKLLI